MLLLLVINTIYYSTIHISLAVFGGLNCTVNADKEYDVIVLIITKIARSLFLYTYWKFIVQKHTVHCGLLDYVLQTPNIIIFVWGSAVGIMKLVFLGFEDRQGSTGFLN